MAIELDVHATLGARSQMAGLVTAVHASVRTRVYTSLNARRAGLVLLTYATYATTLTNTHFTQKHNNTYLCRRQTPHCMAFQLAPVIATAQLSVAPPAARSCLRITARLRHRLVAAHTRDRHAHLARRMRQPLHHHLFHLHVPRSGWPEVLVHQRHANRVVTARRARMLAAGRLVALAARQLARRTLARMAPMRLRMVAARRLATRLLAARRLRLALAAARHRGRRLAAAAAHRAALRTRIALALVAQRRALVLAARQLLAAHLVARRTLAVAALAVARVLGARAHLAALRVARELLAARQLLGLAAAAAALVADDQALAAAAVVAALRADVLAALERFVAGAAARLHVLAARRLGVLLAARTAAQLVARTLAARVAAVAALLATVSAAGERFGAQPIALPVPIAARAFARRIAALAAMLRPAFARGALVRRVTRSTALVRAARQRRGALLLARPSALRTANGSGRRLLAQTLGLDVLRARRTWSGMAEQHAAMAAVGLQALLAQFAA